MIWAGIVVLGFVLGLIVGRWWALLAAFAAAIWIWIQTDVEIPHWLLAFLYGAAAAIGIAAGVAARTRARRPGE